MVIEKTSFEGLLIIKPKIFEDERGYFYESFNHRKFQEEIKLDINFVQDNESKSNFGTLRGLHFQKPPFAQSKLVRVIKGAILDVVVDLRSGSDTYGQHLSIKLSEEDKTQLFVPRGFGHGFLVLSEHAIFSYKVDNYYSANHDSGIKWDDPDLNIDWGLETQQIKLSEKDQNLQSFKHYALDPNFEL